MLFCTSPLSHNILFAFSLPTYLPFFFSPFLVSSLQPLYLPLVLLFLYLVLNSFPHSSHYILSAFLSSHLSPLLRILPCFLPSTSLILLWFSYFFISSFIPSLTSYIISIPLSLLFSPFLPLAFSPSFLPSLFPLSLPLVLPFLYIVIYSLPHLLNFSLPYLLSFPPTCVPSLPSIFLIYRPFPSCIPLSFCTSFHFLNITVSYPSPLPTHAPFLPLSSLQILVLLLSSPASSLIFLPPRILSLFLSLICLPLPHCILSLCSTYACFHPSLFANHSTSPLFPITFPFPRFHPYSSHHFPPFLFQSPPFTVFHSFPSSILCSPRPPTSPPKSPALFPPITTQFLAFPIPSYPILSFPILSFPFLSFPFLSFPFLSYPFLPSPLLLPFLSFPFYLFLTLIFSFSFSSLCYPISPFFLTGSLIVSLLLFLLFLSSLHHAPSLPYLLSARLEGDRMTGIAS